MTLLSKSNCCRSVLLSLLLTTTLSSISLPTAAQSSLLNSQSSSESGNASAQIQTKAEQFVDLLFKHRYSEALQYVHPTLREELMKENNIVNNVQEFQELTGGFKRRLDSRVEDNLVLVNTEFEAVTDIVVVIFDEQGQITGFDFPVEPLRSIHRQRILNN